MPVRKITEQQFRTRRKDRKMVWVDAAAFLVGLIVLAVSVGGVIVIEPEPEPIEWEYSFAEGKVTEKWCYGHIGFRIGCNPIETVKAQLEGTERPLVSKPITVANATQAVWTLTWTDDVPDTENRDSPDYRKDYPYDENSTDIFRLSVTSPTGETQVVEAANAPDASLPNGQIQIFFNITELPETGKMKAFETATVQRHLMEQYTLTEHAALGEWSAVVTMVRAGDQNGTMPTSACSDLPPEGLAALPEDVQKQCNLHDDQDKVEDGARITPGYQASYDDKGNRWILDFTVRTYQSTVSF